MGERGEREVERYTDKQKNRERGGNKKEREKKERWREKGERGRERRT